jgi:hypothetical protein
MRVENLTCSRRKNTIVYDITGRRMEGVYYRSYGTSTMGEKNSTRV